MMKGQIKKLLSAVLSLLIMLSILTGTQFGGLNVSAADRPPYCGIDVSKHNGNINWSIAKFRGVDFAVLRCYSLQKDEYFDQNYAGAIGNGIAVGAYVYMYAENEAEARQEAQGVLNALGGRSLNLPLYLDVEYKKILSYGKKALTDLMLIELEMFRAAGYRPGIYTSMSYIDSYMDASRLQSYSWWVARWTCERPQLYTFQNETPYSIKKPTCDMWQFSNSGDGGYFGTSSSYVDLSFCYIDFKAQTEEPVQPTTPEVPDQPTTPTEPTQPTTQEGSDQAITTILQFCFDMLKWMWNFAISILTLIAGAAN